METANQERVIVDIQDHIAHVRLNRPDKMNALDDAMFEAIIEAGEQLKGNTEIRAVVLSGEGKAFCAGLDMGNFANMASGKSGGEAAAKSDSGMGRLEPRTHGLANRAQYTSWVWREMPVPVIAAIHGVAFGGGCQISIGADMRYAAPGTRFCIMEMKWGLVPDMGATPYLPSLLRDDVLRELTYTNRIVDADEALALGLVTRVGDNPLEMAMQTAGEIAARNPEAIRAAKRILNDAPFQTPQQILLAESREQDKIIGFPNQVEAIMANMEKRTPNFTS
ncbi:MAG: enoyl-CoA hydratase/carnithine racemase [Candidatus Azotimanducaceae bacterium]|jgi:enoyl-CoA hydratase/carnithine racemase